MSDSIPSKDVVPLMREMADSPPYLWGTTNVRQVLRDGVAEIERLRSIINGKTFVTDPGPPQPGAKEQADEGALDRLRDENARLRAALELIAGTYGTECSAPRGVAAKALSGDSSAHETHSPPLCDGEVRVIYEHGEPAGVRDKGGYLCFFNRVTKWTDQEDRYRDELALRSRQAEAIATALRGAQEGDAQKAGEPHSPDEETRADVIAGRLANAVVQQIAEMDDRSSPEDQPEMMLVTGQELHDIICDAFERIAVNGEAEHG